MKSLPFIAVSALALATAACTPPHPAARTALDCPASSGPLSRTGIAPDHKTCTYVNKEGDEVSLQLVSVTGGPEATLKTLEDALSAQYDPPLPEPTDAKSDGKLSDTSADEAAESHKDDVNIHNGSAHIRKDGDRSQIDLPGIHIRADDSTDSASVKVGGIEVNANGSGAIVRVAHDVRLRGDMLSPQRRGFRATYRLARDRLTDGYETVGYEAGGPRAGPLAVAVIKSRDGEHHGVFASATRLVRANGGV